jgi:type II secretory pathway component PulC
MNIRRTTLFSLPAFLLAIVRVDIAIAASSSEPPFRLSGVVTVGDEARVAMIEFPDGRQQTVRRNTSIPDVGKVEKISRDRLWLKTETGEIEIQLTADGLPSEQGHRNLLSPESSSADAAAPTASEAETQPKHRTVEVSEEMAYQIEQLAKTPAATVDELYFALKPMLGLPSAAELKLNGLSFEPMDSVSQIKQQLDQGQMMRAVVQGAEGVEMIYLQPGPTQQP